MLRGSVILRRLVFCAILILSVLCIGSGYGGVFSPDRFMTLPAILALAFPICAVVLLAFSIISLFISVRTDFFGFLNLFIACWQPFRANFPINFTTPETPYDFSLLTYNVAQFVDFSGAGNLTSSPAINHILDTDVDIVALQEYSSSPSNKNFKESVRKLDKTYPYKLTWSDGQAIFSKYPLTALSPVPCQGTRLIARACRVEIGDNPVTLLNLHLRSIGLSEHDKEFYERLTEGHRGKISTIRHSLLAKLRHAFIDRAIQARAVRQWLDSVSGPVIVCGDFNDVPLCYAQRVIMSNELYDAYRESARYPSNTFNDNRMFFRIDHILTDYSLRPVYTVCDRVRYSDHYSIRTNIKFTTQ